MLSRKQARWMEFMSRFHYKWKYIPGRTNVANPLSRSPLLMFIRRIPDTDLPVCTVMQQILDAYGMDVWFNDPKNTKNMHQNACGFWVGNPTARGGPKPNQIVVPNSSVNKYQIMRELHDSISSGHPGHQRTLEKVARMFWWPAMHLDVLDYVRSCSSCQQMKSSSQKPAGQLQPLPIPERRWGSVSMDLITQLPKSHGHDAIVVFVDRLTKMTHFVPCKTR